MRSMAQAWARHRSRSLTSYDGAVPVFGHELWQAAHQSPFILADAEDAVDTGHASLDFGF